MGNSNNARQITIRFDTNWVHLALFDARHMAGGIKNPCPECFDRRCLANLPGEAQWAIQTGERIYGSAEAPLPPTLVDRIVLATVAMLQDDSGCDHRIVSLGMHNGEVRLGGLLADAFCSCADRFEHPAAKERPIAFSPDLAAPAGRNRMRDVRDYALPMRALINPICGAVGVDWTPGYAQSTSAPVFGGYWQRARGARPRRVGWSGLSTRRIDSELVGVLEALERQGGMQPPAPEQIPVRASLAALGDRAMDPTLCFAYNERSYALPLSLTRFDPTLEYDWIWGYSLTRERPVLVPAMLAFYNRLPVGSPFKLVDNNSSGCALGSCFEEAMLKGLFELVERDSFVITWLQQLALPKIDPATIGNPKVDLLLDRLDHLGIEVSFLDARLDLSLPVVIAIARNRDPAIGSIAIGAAAALDPLEALLAALLEAGSSIVELPAMLRHQEAHIRTLAVNHDRVVSVTDHQLLYALPEMAASARWLDGGTTLRSFADTYAAASTLSSNQIGAGLAHCVTMLGEAGLNEVVMVDQTNREQAVLGLKAVRAIVPGLAPIDFGHPRNRAESLPRLRSAPLAAGLTPAPSLNTMPHPFP